jgi:hypothetical protein
MNITPSHRLMRFAAPGVLQKCMPSLVSEPTGGAPALDRIVKEGWVIIATDHSPRRKRRPA